MLVQKFNPDPRALIHRGSYLAGYILFSFNCSHKKNVKFREKYSHLNFILCRKHFETISFEVIVSCKIHALNKPGTRVRFAKVS